jgi:CPA2 family monovalent cation:H+ antiporter-2
MPLMDDYSYGNIVTAVITFIIIAPFLWAVSLRRIATEEVQELLKNKKHHGPILVLIFIRMVIGLFFIGMMLNNFLSPGIAVLAFVISVVIIMLFPKKINKLYLKIENRFVKNYNQRELSVKKINRNNLSPWDGHLANFLIVPESDLVGKPLEEIKIREDIGVNIAYIKRGNLHINVPTKYEKLYPSDEIFVIGTDIQVKEFGDYLKKHEVKVIEEDDSDIVLQQFELEKQDFIGRTIRESELREQSKGLVVGVEHNGRRILNPESNFILSKNDVIWVVGDRKKIAAFFR